MFPDSHFCVKIWNRPSPENSSIAFESPVCHVLCITWMLLIKWLIKILWEYFWEVFYCKSIKPFHWVPSKFSIQSNWNLVQSSVNELYGRSGQSLQNLHDPMMQVASSEQALIKAIRKLIQNHQSKTMLLFKTFISHWSLSLTGISITWSAIRESRVGFLCFLLVISALSGFLCKMAVL